MIMDEQKAVQEVLSTLEAIPRARENTRLLVHSVDV